jgi:hypothetical protein
LKIYGEVEAWLHPFLTLTLDGDEWSAWTVALQLKERAPGTHCIGDWMGIRAGLQAMRRREVLICRYRKINPRPVVVQPRV